MTKAKTKAKPVADPAILEWSIDNRAQVQRTLLALYQFTLKHPRRLKGPKEAILDHLIGAAFSLWRAIFLTEHERTHSSLRNAQKQFLNKLLSTNTVLFADDRESSPWSATYYLDNAGLRIRDIELLVAEHFPKAVRPHGLRHTHHIPDPTTEALRHECTLVDYAIRVYFYVIDPKHKLPILRPQNLEFARWLRNAASAGVIARA
jgi:hypothetical protein